MIATAPATTITLATALHRFEKEGRWGSVATGRYTGRYVRWGSGPPLIFVHGLGDDVQSFVLPMALLADEFQCIAYNQPNGRGDGASLRRYTHDDLAHDLIGLMDHLKLAEAVVLGSSFGSTIALRAMHLAPARLPRGILQGGFAHRPLTPSEWWLARVARYWPGNMRLLPFRRTAMLKAHYKGFAECDAEVWKYFLDQSGKPAIRSVANWALMLHQTDLREKLAEIKQPLLLICGDDDPLVAHYYQEFLFSRLPNAVMFQITGCGHFPMFSHPQAMAEAIRRFHSPACSRNGRHCDNVASVASD